MFSKVNLFKERKTVSNFPLTNKLIHVSSDIDITEQVRDLSKLVKYK